MDCSSGLVPTAEQQVTFPMTWYGTIFNAGRTLADQDGVDNGASSNYTRVRATRRDLHAAPDGYPSIEPLVKAGKLRVIAVTSDRRSPGLDDVPALAEHC